MANIAAAQSGDFSATATWTGGVVPGSGDVAYSNTFTVTISDTRTVQAISNASGTGITVGGTFSLLNGANLTCTNVNGVVQGNTATSCVTTPSLGTGASASVAAAIALTVSSGSSVSFSSSGALSLTGNITGSSASANPTLSVSGVGTLTYTGNITGGPSGGNGPAVSVTGAATVNITGNITGGGFSTTTGLSITNGTVTVTGNVTAAAAAAIVNNGSTTLTVNGTCQSSTTQPAIAAGSASQITRLSGPFLLGASGNINPVQAQSWRWAPTQIPTYMEVPTSGGSTKRNLYTADNMPSGGYPVAANVRQATVYGPSSEFTGTLAVPAASSVALGVAVDNTTGTAILTAANVRSAMGLTLPNLDAQLASAAADSSGVTTLLGRLTSGRATGLDNLDATVSSRSTYAGGDTSGITTLLSRLTATRADYLDNISVAAPTAAAIASAVWSAATRTLTSGADSAATIAAAVWSYVSGRTVTGGTVDTLTNAPSVPSAAQIASQVRTELATELSRLDAAISTRLATSSYATPPTAAAIATQVNTSLDRTGFSLTSAERSAIAVAVEQAILNDGDGQAILNAIVGAIGNQNIDQVALVAAIRADLERTGGTLATRLAASAYSTPPTAAQAAAAVRSELTPELSRVANCSTTDEVAAIVEGATSA